MRAPIPKEPSPLALAIRANRERCIRESLTNTYCGTCGAKLEHGRCQNCGDGGFEPDGISGVATA